MRVAAPPAQMQVVLQLWKDHEHQGKAGTGRGISVKMKPCGVPTCLDLDNELGMQLPEQARQQGDSWKAG